MPMSTFKAARIDFRYLVKPPIAVNSFIESFAMTMGYVKVSFKVRPIHGFTTFHVIDAPVSYHLLIGRTWLHEYNIISSTQHQCMKGYLNGSDILIHATKNPFNCNELHFAEAAFFYEHENEADMTLVESRAKRLPTGEEIKTQEFKKRKKRGCREGAKKRKKAYSSMKMQSTT